MVMRQLTTSLQREARLGAPRVRSHGAAAAGRVNEGGVRGTSHNDGAVLERAGLKGAGTFVSEQSTTPPVARIRALDDANATLAYRTHRKLL